MSVIYIRCEKGSRTKHRIYLGRNGSITLLDHPRERIERVLMGPSTCHKLRDALIEAIRLRKLHEFRQSDLYKLVINKKKLNRWLDKMYNHYLHRTDLKFDYQFRIRTDKLLLPVPKDKETRYNRVYAARAARLVEQRFGIPVAVMLKGHTEQTKLSFGKEGVLLSLPVWTWFDLVDGELVARQGREGRAIIVEYRKAGQWKVETLPDFVHNVWL